MSKPTIDEVGESLTGFDEIAIEKAFKVVGLDNLSGTRAVRAMAFILFKRQGSEDTEAYAGCMSLALKDVMDMFEQDADEVMADEPETEQGKDDSLASAGQTS